MKVYLYKMLREEDDNDFLAFVEGEDGKCILAVGESNYQHLGMSHRNDVDSLHAHLFKIGMIEDADEIIPHHRMQDIIGADGKLRNRMFMFVPISGYHDMEPLRISAVNLIERGFTPIDIQKLMSLSVGAAVYLPNGTCDCTMIRLHDES